MLKQQDILNYLTAHKKEFQEKYNIEKIGLFGSNELIKTKSSPKGLGMFEEKY
jgi:predicted nucleotidyltransferase